MLSSSTRSQETGNELNGASAAWTNEIADFIKGELGAQQLVFDGIDSERLGGVAHVPEAELAAKNVDCYTDHFYPTKPDMVVASAAAAKAADKVYYVRRLTLHCRQSPERTLLTQR